MDLQEFYEIGIRHFYGKAEYDDVNINYIFCDDLYKTALENSPSERYTELLNNNSDSINKMNGMCIPFYSISDGSNVLISKKVFKNYQYTSFGTFQHETTHAHDYALLSKVLNCSTIDEIRENSDHDWAMNIISEANARKNGFSFVRELVYKFVDEEEEKNHIVEKELPLLIQSIQKIDSEYELGQLFGRLLVLDKFPECNIKERVYNELIRSNHIISKEWCERYFSIYEICR